jgi:hypothetical protein
MYAAFYGQLEGNLGKSSTMGMEIVFIDLISDVKTPPNRNRHIPHFFPLYFSAQTRQKLSINDKEVTETRNKFIDLFLVFRSEL